MIRKYLIAAWYSRCWRNLGMFNLCAAAAFRQSAAPGRTQTVTIEESLLDL
jgi:hypothetical protein